jgi:hypothetical protein
MTKDKIREVIKEYKQMLMFKECRKIRSNESIVQTSSEVLNHCYYMLDKMEILIAEDRMEKVFRWLGFVQGCLWSLGFFSVDSLKNHNKPNEEN